ncbi:uncharacterized protein LOC141646375 [Silene latifolia]|uniref:uncharacterized protein LOC141646375 n=1 Tax=Silene latifolia TaxID=37657 RepID=UPI003D786BC7
MSIPHPTAFKSDKPDAPAKDRGLFDCFGKKEAKHDVPMTEAEHKPTLMEKLHRSGSSSSSSSEEEVEEGGMKIRRRKKKGLTDKIKAKLPGHKNEGPDPFAEGDHNHQHAPEGMHYDEKKGFVEKIKDKMSGNHKDETAFGEGDYKHKHAPEEMHSSDDSKGFLEEIKDKMPGNHKDETVITPAYTAAPEPVAAHAPTPAPQYCQPGGHCGGEHGSNESPEKKGIFDKIKDMLPGGHKDGDEAKKV